MKRKDLTGTLKKNENAKSEKHPGYKGYCVVGGVEYWIAAWVNAGDDGRKYFSLKFEPKEQPKQETRQQPAPGQGKPSAQDDDGDIPF
jgi:uncharacterized protein (DUF736 family)